MREEQKPDLTHHMLQPGSELRRRAVMFGICYTFVL